MDDFSSSGSVEAAPLGRALAKSATELLGQIGDQCPADVLTPLAGVGVNVCARARVNLTNVTTAQALHRELLHLPDESAAFGSRQSLVRGTRSIRRVFGLDFLAADR